MGEIRGLFLISIVFTAFLVGSLAFYADLSTRYGILSTDNDKMNITYLNSTWEKIRTQSDQMSQAIQSNPGTGTADQWWIQTTGVFNALNLVFSSVGMTQNIITLTGAALGIPPIFITLALVSVSVLVIFAILKAVLKWEI